MSCGVRGEYNARARGAARQGAKAASAAENMGLDALRYRPAEPLPLLQGLGIRRLRVGKGGDQMAAHLNARTPLEPEVP